MNHEIDRFLEANPELFRQFTDTFIARWDTYPFQLPDGSYSRAHKKQPDETKLYSPLTSGHIEGHLKGGVTLGAYIMNEESVTTKIVFDDDDEQIGLGRLQGFAQDLKHEGIPSYLEQSRRGGHLWLFTPPLSGRDARRFGKCLLATRNIAGIELYPKQEFVRKDAVGSLVRLPFGRHRITGEHYGFLTLEGKKLADRRRDQLQIVATPERVSQSYIDGILSIAPEAKRTFALDRRRLKGLAANVPPDERIKRAIAPRDFIAQYVEVDSSGRGLCPFHDDHKQSFKVYDDGWHCFAGCEGNTVIDFYIKWKGYHSLNLPKEDFKQVLYEMMKMLGM